MATITKSQGKTSFVKDFLRENPRAKTPAVNDAWAAAGMKGTISHTVISEARKQLGLLTNQPAPTRKVGAGKAASKMAQTGSSPGKTMFVKEYLNDHPQGNVGAVNDAWQSAGFDGTISPTLVNKMRALLGLTGNIRGNPEKFKMGAREKKPATPREPMAKATARPSGPTRDSKGDRTNALLVVEAEIDKLIFQIMGIGDLPEVETALRDARRRVYGAFSS